MTLEAILDVLGKDLEERHIVKNASSLSRLDLALVLLDTYIALVCPEYI